MATRLTQMFRIPLGAQVRELTDAVGLLFLGKGHFNEARFHDSPQFHAYSLPKDTAAILDDPSDRDSGLDELRPVITPKELR